MPGSSDSCYTDFVVGFCAIPFKFNSQTERPRFDRTLHSEVNERYEIAFSLYRTLSAVYCAFGAHFFLLLSGYREYRACHSVLKEATMQEVQLNQLNAWSLPKASIYPKLNCDSDFL